MGLAEQLGAVDPQGVVTGLIADQAPDLVQNNAVDPQAVLNRLIRKGLDSRQQKQLKHGLEQEQTAPDLSSFGKTSDEIGAQPQPDFSSFGQAEPTETPLPTPRPAEAPAGQGQQEPSFLAPTNPIDAAQRASKAAGESGGVAAREAGQAAIAGVGKAIKGLALTPPGTAASVDVPYVEGLEKQPKEPPQPVAQQPAYKTGEAVEKFAKENIPVSEEERAAHPIASTFGGAVGGMIAPLAIGAVDPVAGLVSAAAMFGLSGSAETYDAAKAKGADEATAKEAAALSGAMNAALGVLPVGVVLKPFESLMPQAAGLGVRILAQAAQSGIVFGTVGEAQTYLGQQIAKLYDSKAGYDLPLTTKAATERLIGELMAGAALGGGHAIARELSQGQSNAQPNAQAQPNAGNLPPPAGAASAAGAQPGPRPGTGGAGAAPAEPFATKMHPDLRAATEAAATGFGATAAEAKSWSDEKLKDFVREGNVKAAGADNTPEPQHGTREAPIDIKTGADIDAIVRAGNEDYSHEQGEANNIQRVHATWNGLPITIETGANNIRRGTNPKTGEPWESQMGAPYGYVKGTEGADGDHVDVYLGKHPNGNPPVYVIDEVDRNTGKFRQHKAFIGFQTPAEAHQAYVASTGKSHDTVGGMRAMSPDEFKAWVKTGDTKAPLSEAMTTKAKAKTKAKAESILPDEPEVGPQHHAAVDQAIRAAGENPDHVRPADIARAAELHAQGAPADDAFVVATLQGLVDDGLISHEALTKAVGDGEATDILEAGNGAQRGARAETRSAATGRPTAAGENGVAALGAENGARKEAEVEPGRVEREAGGVKRGQDTGGAANPENGGRTADHAAGGERAAEAGSGRAGGEPAKRDGEQVAALGQAAEDADHALIGRRVDIPEHKVTAADNKSIRVVPVVVDASKLIASSDKGYDASLQPRQRARAASRAQVREIATRLDPERLGYSAEADRGAPIVGPDGMVESGNGRVMALREVYAGKSPNGDRYREWLKRQGADIAGMKNPVLVRQRITALSTEERRAFTVSANQAATLSMSAPERALADAEHIKPAMLALIENGNNLGAVENRPFIRAFVAAIPASERGALANEQGGLSAEGLSRARNAVLAKAYGDADLLARITESTDDEIKSISNALVAAAPRWAQLKAEVEAGHVRRDMDVTADLLEAVKRTADIRGRGQKLDAALAQTDALDQIKGPVEDWMRSFYDPKTGRAASSAAISRALDTYAEQAAKVTAHPGLGLDIPEVTAHETQRAALAKAKKLPAGPGAGDGENDGEGRPAAAGSGHGEAGEGPAPADESELERGFGEPESRVTEKTPIGDQYVIPGAERLSGPDLARRRAAEPLKPKAPQKPVGGLFDEVEKQVDLEEAIKTAAKGLKAAEPAPHIDTTERGHGRESQGIREGAPPVSAGKPPGRARKNQTKPARPAQLSLFDRGASERPVPHVAGAEEQRPGSAEPSVPPESGEVTKPPARSSGSRAPRDRVPAGAERGLTEARAKIAERSRLNYRITEEDKIGEGGPKQKVRANLDAIRVLKTVEDEKRLPTPEEKAKLVKYVGWGAYAQDVFASHKPEWKAEREALRALLDDAEFASAKASTLNAHYTSPDVIRGMWDALSHLGYKGGMAIEPSAGVGHFIGLIPDKMAPRTAWTAVELDPITGRIAKLLYGGAEVNVEGYQDLKRPSNYYDLAISNVPFGNYNITEKPYGTYPIHDFFFVKSIDKVRPGGVVAFITSRYTMDRKDDATRRLLARSADLIGAIRLPGGKKGAFAGNAGTEVTTDILFLRKKVPGEHEFPGTDWMGLKDATTADGKPLTIGDEPAAQINEYFANHPDMMLGTLALEGTQYRKNELVLIGDPEGLREKIAAAARAGLPEGAMMPRGSRPPPETVHANDIEGSVKDGAFFLKGGKVYQKRAGSGYEQSVAADDKDRLQRLVGIRDIVNDLLDAQLNERKTESGRSVSEIHREKLVRAYKAFTDKWGPINKEITTVTSRMNKAGEPVVITRQPNLAKFLGDPDAWKVAAIENYDAETGTAKPADIQIKDVIAAPAERQINSPADALGASLDQHGEIDVDHIAEMLGLASREEAIAKMGDLVFLNPDGRKYQSADAYLSGNVVSKLEEARSIAKDDPTYERNVKALEKVQPALLTRADISAQMGAPWVPEHVYEAFLREHLGAGTGQVRRVPVTGEWKVNVGQISREARTKYATDRASIEAVVKAAINNQQVTVYDKDADGKSVANHEETQKARIKTEALKEAFSGDVDSAGQGWVWTDNDRATELEGIYNRTYNNLVPLKVDGSHLTFPGLNPMFSDRQHRKDAVWRMIQYGNTLLAHVVGSGKTVTMIAGGMEMKRLGLINKPAYAVPNHMLEQFSREFIQAYPNAKILVAQKDEMTRENRREFIAKVAANDWDGVIITHDAFGRINMAREFREQFIRDQLEELERVMQAEVAADGKASPTVKGLEKAKKRLDEKLDKLLNSERKDEGVTFEESGIDHLFVDEAHKFKNLAFITRLQRVKGLAQGDSQRAEDLFLKLRYLEQKRPGRSAVFATGTPVSNTMAELWTMQRYLQLDKLRERDLDTFDAWAATFGRVVNNMELSADGRTLKEVSSFSKFVNVPELIAIYAEIADTKTADMLKLPRPDVRGPDGKPGIEIIEARPSPAEEGYINELVKLAESLKGKRPEPGQPNMLSVVTRGRKVATDGRLVGISEINPHGKLSLAVKNIYDIWKEGKEPGTVQMVFLDMGVPQSRSAAKPKAADKGPQPAVVLGPDNEFDPNSDPTNTSLVPKINLYADIKSRLVAMGIPEKEIAAIHDATDDAKKAKLFQKVRAGVVRVLLGSTEKMGVGTNVQDRLIAMHHLDAPWKPAEVEQRDGRIVRQGNKNPFVRILRYVTKKSFDAFMWQKLDTKSKFIGQVLSGAKGSRHAEDIDNPLPEAAEMKAAASGDPRILEHAELDRQIRQLTAQKRVFDDAKSRASYQRGQAASNIKEYEAALPDAKADAAKAQDLSGDKFKVELDGTEHADRKEAGEKILQKVLSLDHQTFYSPKAVQIGAMSGFDMKVTLQAHYHETAGVYLSGTPSLQGAKGHASNTDVIFNGQTNPAGIMTRYQNILDAIRSDPKRLETAIAHEKENLAGINRMLGETWPKEKELSELKAKLDALTKDMMGVVEKPGEQAVREYLDAIPEESMARSLGKRAAKGILPAFATKEDVFRQLGADLKDMRERTPTEKIMDTPERRELQNRIARQLDDNDGYAFDPGDTVPRKFEKRADLVLGLPAAGKSSNAVEPLLKAHGAMLLDSDEAKKLIPEFDDGRGANVVHVESARIAENLLRNKAIARGANVVQPLIGKNTQKISDLIDAYKKQGYAVNLHYVDLPPEKALTRALTRYIEDGRLLDPAYINGLDHLAKKTFDELKNRSDLQSVQAVSTDVGFGEPPIVTEQRGDEQAYPGLGRGQSGRSPERLAAPGGLTDALAEPEAPFRAPVFYSAVSRAIENVKLDKASPEQWLGTLRNAPGVKPEEMAWLGLDDWLKEQTGPVTKATIADYVRANQIEVREVEKGTPAEGPLSDSDVIAFQDISREVWDDATPTERGTMRQEAETFGTPNATKFSGYQLPGGENYRELLLTLPVPQEARVTKYRVFDAQGTEHASNMVGREAADRELARYPGGRMEEYPSTIAAEQQFKDRVFTSSHWDEPNVVAHIRFNDRITSADGTSYTPPQRTLFIEEIQSDWHQKGKRQGYGPGESYTRYQLLNDKGGSEGVYGSRQDAAAALVRLHGVIYPGERTPNDTSKWKVAEVKVTASTGVPDAPFKTTWPELTLKRMIRYAAENGYDKLAWTPGDVQAARYDLSKQLSRIEFTKTPERDGIPASWSVWAYDHHGNEIITKQNYPPNETAEFIGKEMAQKIADSPDAAGKFTGLDLKVGGEGMAGFYDKILPAAANKLVKKFGAKVEAASIKTTKPQSEYGGVSGEMVGRDRGMTDEEISRWWPRLSAAERDEAIASYRAEKVGQPVHSLTITPELRRAAVEHGFPLFEGRAQGGMSAVDARHTDLGTYRFKPGQPIGQQAQAYITERGRASGVEYILAVDKNGKVAAHGHGTKRSTGDSAPLWQAMQDPGRAVVIHHNHPSDSGLSTIDLAHLAMPGVAAIWSHGHGGYVTRASLTPQAAARIKNENAERLRVEFFRLFDTIESSFVDPLQVAVSAGVMTPDQAQKTYTYMLGAALHRAGVVDYRASDDHARNIERFGLEPYIEKAARAVEGAFFNVPGSTPAIGADRPPEPLRHLADLGAVFNRVEDAAPERPQPSRDLRRRASDRAEAAGQVRLPGFAEPPEKVISAAVQHEGKIYTGALHSDAWEAALKDQPVEGMSVDEAQDGSYANGFITNRGRYVDLKEAMEIARERDQVYDADQGSQLASENLKPWDDADVEHNNAVLDRATRPRHEKEFLTVDDKPTWAMVVSNDDHAVLGTVRFNQAERGDFHHSHYLPHKLAALVNAEEARVVWGDKNGLHSMEPMPPAMRADLAQYYGKGMPEGFAEGENRFKQGPQAGAAAGGAGGRTPPPGGTTTAAPAPKPPNRGRRPITGRLAQTALVRSFKDFWASTFQPELFSDRALEADPLFARYKSAQAIEKASIVRAGESEWNYWNKRGEPERIRFLDDMETAIFGAVPPDPKQAAMARRYRAMLDANWKLEKQFGSQAGFVEDYFPHIWEKPDAWRAYSATQSAQVGPTWFQKKRTIDYITHGLAAGLKLKYTNPVDIVVHRLLSGVDMRQRMQLLFDLKKMGLAWEGEQGGEQLVRRGWRAINAPDRKQWVIAPDVQLLWKNAVEAKGYWQAEHVGGSAFRGWMALKGAWIPVRLALTAFHPLHVIHINYVDGMARAWGDVVKGHDPLAALKSFAGGYLGPMQAAPGATTGAAVGAVAGAFTPIGPYWGGFAGALAGATAMKTAKKLGMPDMPHKGKAAREAARTRPTQRTPEQRATVALFEEMGFVPDLSEQFKITAKKSLHEAWQKIVRQEGGVSDWRKLISSTLRRPIEILQKPIFEDWIPNLKAAAALDSAAALFRQQPHLLNDEVRRRIALRAIGQQIDSRFGEKFYGAMFWNRYLKDASIGTFLSLGWNYGFVQQFGGAAMETVTRPLGVLPPFAPSAGRKTIRAATNKLTFAIAYLGSAALLNALMTLAYTGETPKDLDYIFARMGGINPDGSPRRLANMFYLREIPMLLKHVQERGGNWLTGSFEMLTNKLLVEPFKELLNNRDYYGYNIWDENAPIYKQIWQGLWHTLGEQGSPMSISGGKRAAEYSGHPFPSLGEAIKEPRKLLDALTAKGVGESAAGFSPAPAYVEKSALQNRIAYLYRMHTLPESRPEEAGQLAPEKASVRTAIMIARQNKDMPALTEAYQRGKALGMKPDMMNKIGREPTDHYQFAQLPASDQKALLEKMSPEEFKTYWPRSHQAVKQEWNRAHAAPAAAAAPAF